MRKLLLVSVLLSLWAIPAKTSLSLAMFPHDKRYVLSLAQQTPTAAWDGQLTFSAPDELVINLPSRFRITRGNALISLGYGGFWQEYALLPLFAPQQALLYQKGGNAFALVLSRTAETKAIGYEHTLAKGTLSALAWMQPKVESSSFQTEWGARHSWWGVGAKVHVAYPFLELGAELLFTPVQGLVSYLFSAYTNGPSKLSFSYGQESYPSRYCLSLELESSFLRATFVMEDWFGSEPIYGGFSAMRKRWQSSDLRFALAKGYLLFSFSDTYELKQRGSEVGSVMMQATWGGPFGQVSAKYKKVRGLSGEGKAQYMLCLAAYKATLSYTQEGYELTISDSVAIGAGIGTWKLHASMGKAITLSLLYAVTSDR